LNKKNNNKKWKLGLIFILCLVSSLLQTNNSNIFGINYINVAYAFDNYYFYITHVSMKSIMLSQKNNTFIKFYILVWKNIYEEQKPIIDKICIEHKNCNITYLILKNEFKEISTKGIIERTTAIFYRLLLQNLLPKEKKILYFDCDIVVYKDLNEIYNYNNYNKYYIGQYEGKPINKYGNKLKDFINSGAILINLELLRKDNIFPKIYQFLKVNNGSLLFLDQDAINVVCNKKNGFFPSYYFGSYLCNLEYISKINKKHLNKNHIIQNIKEPYLYHFKIFVKPWYGIARNKDNMICFDFIIRFYEFAKKSSYYLEILEKFKVFMK